MNCNLELSFETDCKALSTEEWVVNAESGFKSVFIQKIFFFF